MNKLRLAIRLLVVAAFVFAFTSLTQAQTRTWVSGVGDDLNPCSRTAPCKTYAGAISKTADKGEISTLDPGGFGAVTITKNITIDGTKGGGFGSILAAGFTGVNVNDSATATPGTIVVILRNLSINGASNGTGNGIRFTSGKTLIVEDCQIFGFTGNAPAGTNGRGIDADLNANDKNVVVINTSIENCTVGIRLRNTGANIVQGTFDRVSMEQPTATVASGIELGTGAIATIRDSYITRYQTGINVTGASPAAAVLLRSTVFNCTTGINAGSTTFRAAGSHIMFNSAGVALAGGTFRSGCDNFIENNTNNVTGGGITNACVQ